MFKSVAALMILVSSSASAAADNSVQCGAALAFFGREGNCTYFHRGNNHFSAGLRLSRSIVQLDTANAGLLILSLRPGTGSYFFELGMGAAQTYSHHNDEESSAFGGEFRMGNRWTLNSGLILGLNYLGGQFFDSFGSFLLFGPEIGWTF